MSVAYRRFYYDNNSLPVIPKVFLNVGCALSMVIDCISAVRVCPIYKTASKPNENETIY